MEVAVLNPSSVTPLQQCDIYICPHGVVPFRDPGGVNTYVGYWELADMMKPPGAWITTNSIFSLPSPHKSSGD